MIDADKARFYPLLQSMLRRGWPVTRESYIALSHMGHPPAEWTVEDEGELPPSLQDWSLFEIRDGAYVLKETTRCIG
jgi:hypothetical protein